MTVYYIGGDSIWRVSVDGSAPRGGAEGKQTFVVKQMLTTYFFYIPKPDIKNTPKIDVVLIHAHIPKR